MEADVQPCAPAWLYHACLQEDPAMQAYMFPMLRDDFQLVETYTVRIPKQEKQSVT
jgi:surfactin synthase thioesterase subunit